MRQVHGIYISTPPCDMEGAYESSNMGLLVLGGGRKVWEDYETAKGLFDKIVNSTGNETVSDFSNFIKTASDKIPQPITNLLTTTV